MQGQLQGQNFNGCHAVIVPFGIISSEDSHYKQWFKIEAFPIEKDGDIEATLTQFNEDWLDGEREFADITFNLETQNSVGKKFQFYFADAPLPGQLHDAQNFCLFVDFNEEGTNYKPSSDV